MPDRHLNNLPVCKRDSKESQFAARLAAKGFRVLIPLLINRRSLMKADWANDIPERIYRQAFHMGRHIIGYEVQKVLSAIDCLSAAGEKIKNGIAGFCEGGLMLLCRWQSTKEWCCSGQRLLLFTQNVWDETTYRNVWGLLLNSGMLK